MWCAQSVGVAARTQHLHGRRQGKLFFPATSLTSYIEYNKLYETLKHATTDQCYATCYGLRSPLADCDRSTRRAQAIGSLLGPAARLDSQRRINDPAEFPSACHAAWGSFVSVPSLRLHSAVSAPRSVLSRANLNARLRTASNRDGELACVRLSLFSSATNHPRTTGDLANRFCVGKKTEDGHAAGGLRGSRVVVSTLPLATHSCARDSYGCILALLNRTCIGLAPPFTSDFFHLAFRHWPASLVAFAAGT